MVCPPVQGDNPRALENGLSPIQADNLWYIYFIPPSSLRTLLSMKYFLQKFAIADKGSTVAIALNVTVFLRFERLCNAFLVRESARLKRADSHFSVYLSFHIANQIASRENTCERVFYAIFAIFS